MTVALRDLAALVDGRLIGDGATEIRGASPLAEASEGHVTLVDNAKALARLARTQAAAVIVPTNVQPDGLPCIQVENVHQAFVRIMEAFRPPRQAALQTISPAAHISPTAKIGAQVTIYPGATIGDDVVVGDRCVIHAGVHIMAGCRLAEDVTLYPNVVLYDSTVVGPRVIIHAGSVVGAFGFGYYNVDGKHERAAQLGYVELGADVEIGACAAVDRGTYGATVVGEGTKIDNMVQIAHNCRIGRHNLICSQVGIAGSSTTGDYVVIAGQVGVADHIDIGHRVTLGGMSGVMSNIPDDSTYVGIPATPARDQMVKQAALAKLPEMRKQLRAIQETVAILLGASTREAA